MQEFGLRDLTRERGAVAVGTPSALAVFPSHPTGLFCVRVVTRKELMFGLEESWRVTGSAACGRGRVVLNARSVFE